MENKEPVDNIKVLSQTPEDSTTKSKQDDTKIEHSSLENPKIITTNESNQVTEKGNDIKSQINTIGNENNDLKVNAIKIEPNINIVSSDLNTNDNEKNESKITDNNKRSEILNDEVSNNEKAAKEKNESDQNEISKDEITIKKETVQDKVSNDESIVAREAVNGHTDVKECIDGNTVSNKPLDDTSISRSIQINNSENKINNNELKEIKEQDIIVTKNDVVNELNQVDNSNSVNEKSISVRSRVDIIEEGNQVINNSKENENNRPGNDNVLNIKSFTEKAEVHAQHGEKKEDTTTTGTNQNHDSKNESTHAVKATATVQSNSPNIDVVNNFDQPSKNDTQSVGANKNTTSVSTENISADDTVKEISDTAEEKDDNLPLKGDISTSSTESFEEITGFVEVEGSKKNQDDIKEKINVIDNSANEASSEQPLLRLLGAGCRFDQLPPLPKKVVRIFVSSTFTDTKEERNALMQHVYPKLSDYCRDKHGLEFQIVDMRWGVPEQASDNHTTSELCIQEIKKCQQVSAGPNFVAIVGDKYGYRPIPNAMHCDVFKALQNTSVEFKEDWQVVEDWYKQDTNATPPVYILQPISSKIENYHNKDDAELRKAASDKWNSLNQTLTKTLRRASALAYEQGKIDEKQKQLFFMSVTENEITSGLIDTDQKMDEACYVIIRKIPDIDQYISEKTGPRFADVTPSNQIDDEARHLLKELRDCKLVKKLPESNLTKLDIEWSASGAAVSIEQFQDVDVVKYAQKMLKDKEMLAYKHKEYLDKICTDFFKKICKLVNQGSMKQMQMYDELSTELLQHFHLAKMRCDMFEGRQDILSQAKDYLINSETSHPLVIYGNSGCGKTSVMAKIMEQVSNSNWKQDDKSAYIIVARFLGTTTKTSNVHQLLVTMCLQLSEIFHIEWEEPEQFSELVKSFYKLLENASSAKPILLLLDSIDQLMPVYNAYKLDWLPEEFPPHVKVVASTIDEGYTILDSIKEKYQSVGLECIEVKPLGEKLGMDIIRKWLQNDGRTMTTQQAQVIQSALLKCSLPLYARIAYDHIRKWKSYDIPTIEQLETTVKGAINKLYQHMEDKFGQVIVKHCLAYLTASRYGLSEAELEHILSLDDALLNKVFRFWKPPVRRIPPLIWTRIRAEVHSYIVERSADDTLVLYWYHRQFIQTTRSRYLQEEEFHKHVNDHLIEYFNGDWGNGKEKPFKYTDAQVKRFQLDSPNSSADRKVPAQAYWVENKTAFGEMNIRYNKRKLSELPYHLLKNKNFAKLKEKTFFNYEWLYAKIKSTSAQQMIEEIDIFMQASKVLKSDTENKLLYANLQLIRPYIIRYPDSLSYELAGRLSKYIGKYPNITNLIKQCDSIGNEHCPLLPLTTCFETAGLGFTQNLIYRKTEPWHQGGAFVCSPDFKYIYIIDYNDEGLPILLTWDIASGEKINEVVINKMKNEENKYTTDLYFQAELVNDGKWILACFKQRMDATFGKLIQPGSGFMDVIEIETGNVRATHDTFMYRDEFFDPIIYFTRNYVSHTLGWKKPLINLTMDTKQNYNRPTLLSKNEKYFIMCGKDQSELRDFESKGTIGIFDVSEAQIGVAASNDFRTVVMMGGESKNITVFDLLNKKLEVKESFNLIKSKRIWKLDEKTAADVAIVFKPILETNKEGRVQEKTNNRVVMKISANSQHLMVCFVGWKWMAFLWTIYSPSKHHARFVGPVIPFRMPCTYKLPIFSYDSSAVICTRKRKILIVSTFNAEIVNEYEMKEDIKDIRTSDVSDKVVVMLQKSIMLLNIAKPQADQSKGKIKVNEATIDVLFHREIMKGVIHKEVIYKAWEDNLEFEQVDDLAVGIDTDRITSATTRTKHALSKYTTPNGQRAVHFHRRAQVIDTKNDTVKYTPKSGDQVYRTIIGTDGNATNEWIPIPGLDPTVNSSNALILKPNDKVMNKETNKIKFRVNKEPTGQFQIMTVPSVITVYTTEDLKLRKLHRITVYLEQILEVSNSYIVTSKNKANIHFVNVYKQEDGKLLATHDMPSACECARFSFDEVQLFVVDRSLTVKVFQSPTFASTEAKVNLMEGQIASAFVVKDIIHFPKNRECLLVRYGPEGPDVYVKSRYLYFNMITGEKSEEMKITPCFGDISMDGKYAIDNGLNIYDLKVGKVITKLDYNKKLAENERERQVQVVVNRRMRYHELSASLLLSTYMTDDGFIVFVNRQDNTLHIYMMTGRRVRHIVSCFTHASDMITKGLSVRQHEKIILLTTPSSTIAIAINKNKVANYNYQGDLSRCLSIVQNIDQQQRATQKLNIKMHENSTTSSIFHRRKALLQQIESEKTAKNRERIMNPGDACKPTVLYVSEKTLCSNIFNSNKFSPNLITEKMTVENVNDALTKFKEDTYTYDVIILQLITDDVPIYDANICIKKMSLVIEVAKGKARVVIISLAPPRTDIKEFGERIQEVNEKLTSIYASSCSNGKHIHICKNTNMHDKGKPVARYFKDSVILSPVGVKCLVTNLKQTLAPLMGLHHI